jgi:hypothetical protein
MIGSLDRLAKKSYVVFQASLRPIALSPNMKRSVMKKEMVEPNRY